MKNNPSQKDLETLANKVGSLLFANGCLLATAESCTGGWAAQCLTSIAGSSQWFDRGYVTYSNQAKQEMLGVSLETLNRLGAVSEAVAGQMAQGALSRSKADWAVSITGIAGPTGGSPEKPVGTLCFAWAGPENSLETQTRYFSGTRAQIRAQAVAYALEGIFIRVNCARA